MRNLPERWRNERGMSEYSSRDPFRTLQREIDRLFSDFLEPSSSAWGGREVAFAPPCDIEEGDDHFLLSFDLPGMTEKDIKVEISGSQLRVWGERKREWEEKEGKSTHRTERYYGSFERILSLPDNVDPDRVEARFDHGVLRIAVPKIASAKSREIPIGQTPGGFFSRLTSKVSGKSETPRTQEKSA